MQVLTLQRFITSLTQPLEALELNQSANKKASQSLSEMADALEPFRALSIEVLTDLLKATDTMQREGKFPDWLMSRKPSGGGSRTPKPPKAAPAEIVAELRVLLGRASGLDPEAIRLELAPLNKLTVTELKSIQRDFLGGISGSKKADLIAAIEKKLQDHRAHHARAEVIRNF